MDVRILGPFDVREGDRALELGGPRPRSLLAALVVSAGDVVSTDALIDAVWGESPPRSAGHLIHVYVSTLRRALTVGERTPLRTRAPGYLLDLHPEELDAWRFEAQAAAGRRLMAVGEPERAAAAFDDALALWRGPPLADFTYESFAQATIARLEELHVALREDRLEADLALGRHADATPELESLVRTFPYRERLRAQLMLALYRAGRQAEALAAYRDTRATLVAELGIEPSEELRELEQAILRQDPALALTLPSVSRGRPGRKLVSVLAVTTRDDLDPEVGARTRALVRDTVDRFALAFGGSADPTTGGERVAYFGIPAAHEDDAARAVRAAHAVRAQLESDGVDVSIAVDAGEVVVGEDGAVEGAIAARALALSRGTAAGEITVGAEAERLRTARDRAREGAGPVPLVGRWDELGRLADCVDGASTVVVVTGDAGLGKSRLVAELVRAAPAGTAVGVGSCAPYGDPATLAPAIAALREALGEDPGVRARAVLAREEGGARLADVIASASGYGTAAASTGEMFVAFRRLLTAVCREATLLLVLEDVHWGADPLLDLVEEVVATLRDVRLTVVCTARPDLTERRPRWLQSSVGVEWVELVPLTEEESAILLDNLTPGEPLSEELRAGVLAAAEGNPLFVEQLLAMLRDPRASETDRSLPPSIRAVLAARVDTLGPGERAVAERAAVIGREFDVETVAALLPDPARQSTRRHLDALTRRRFVERAPSRRVGFRFQHALTQEAVYRATPKRVRATLHALHADNLLGKPSSETSDAVIGEHLAQAHALLLELGAADADVFTLARRAYEHLARAGKRALDRGDVTAARTTLERAIGLADEPGSDVLAALAEAHALAGAPAQAAQARTRALAAARTAGEDRLALNIEVAEAEAAFFADIEASDAVLDRTTQLIARGEALADARALARTWSIIGRVAMAAGRHADAADALEQALVYAERAGDRLVHDLAGVSLVNELGDGPTPVADVLRRADALRPTLGPLGATQLGPTVGFMLTMAGRFDEARAVFDRTKELNAERGVPSVVLATLVGEAALIRGAAGEAEESLAQSAGLLTERDQAIPWVRERYARALRETRKLAEAEHSLAIARQHVSTAQGELVARTLATRALVLLDRGQREAAVAVALDAERLSEALDGPPLESPRYRGEILLAVAEVLAAVGRRSDAHARATAAAERFGRKGDVVSQRRALELGRSSRAVSPGVR